MYSTMQIEKNRAKYPDSFFHYNYILYTEIFYLKEIDLHITLILPTSYFFLAREVFGVDL